jgi:internalin A
LLAVIMAFCAAQLPWAAYGKEGNTGYLVRVTDTTDLTYTHLYDSYLFMTNRPEEKYFQANSINSEYVIAINRSSFGKNKIDMISFGCLSFEKVCGFCFYSDVDLDRDVIVELSRDKRVKYLMIGTSNISNNDVEKLLENNSLCYLVINGSKVSDFPQIVTPNKSINIMALQNAALTCAAITHLGKWPKLRQLDFQECVFPIEVAQAVATFTNLEALILQSAKTSDDAFAKLLTSKTLKHLDLSHTSIDGSGLRGCNNDALVSLNISNTKLSDDYVLDLKGLRSLKAVNMASTRITTKCVESIASLKDLEELSLAESQLGLRRIIDDGAAEQISRLQKLVRLDLSQSKITKKGLAFIQLIPTLEHLTLDRTDISDEAVPILTKMKKLKGLSLVQCNLSESGLKKLSDELPNCRIR